MVDDRPQPPDLIATGFVTLLENLRSDVREDLQGVEERMTAQVAALDNKVDEFRKDSIETVRAHAELHEQEDHERRKAHGIFYEYIRTAELDKARRDGALGIMRFTFELVGKHGGRIAQILIALAALLGIASGSISVGVR